MTRVLGALVLGFCALVGCRPEEPRDVPKAPPRNAAVPPSEYMNDPAFRKTLDNQVDKRKALVKTRQKLQREMVAKIEAVKARMPKADDAAIKRELEKDAEWNSLYKRISDVNTAYADNRHETAGILRERMMPKGDEQKPNQK